MSIIEELDAALKVAMRERDQQRLDVIRAVKTELTKKRSEPGFAGDLDDAAVVDVMASFVKRNAKAREEYLELGDRGQAMAEKLAWENEFLATWLPTKLDEDATSALVGDTIVALGATGPGDTGKVIGALMKQHREELDGALVSRLVKERLAGG